ncbi:MAG: hypothetical protein RRB13_15370 [bacterium]|nr:hypothetical protein [bacterium]
MKTRIPLLIASCLILFSAPQAKAGGLLMLSGGAASANIDYATTGTELTEAFQALDHKLTGSGSVAGLYWAPDFGLLIGVGYQSYLMTGKANWKETNYTLDGTTFDTIEIDVQQSKLALAGNFGAFGFHFNIGESVTVMPQVRQGTAKMTYQEEGSVSLSLGGLSGSGDYLGEYTDSVPLRVYALPILFAVNDNLMLGFEAQSLATTITIEDSTESMTFNLENGFMLSLATRF